MKRHLLGLVLGLSWIQTAVVYATVGVSSELTFPSGTASVSGSKQAVAVTESYIVVGVPSATYGGTAAAGEVQVFSAVTGKYLRRLRSPKPMVSGAFGGLVAVNGSRVFIVEAASRVHAYELATGARVWSQAFDQGQSINSGSIGSLAVDGDTLLVGMPTGWVAENPVFDQFAFQGIIRCMSCVDGQTRTFFNPVIGQEFCGYGTVMGLLGAQLVVGSPSRDVGGKMSCGMVTFSRMVPGGTVSTDVVPADVADGDEFGSAVAITSDYVFVGSPKADTNGRSDVGCVYVYDAKSYQLIKRIEAPWILANGCRFGSALSVSNNRLVIGALGSVWLYDVRLVSLEELLDAAPGKTNVLGGSVSVFGSTMVANDRLAIGGSAAVGRVHRVTGLVRGWGAGWVLASTKTAASGLSGPVFSGFGETAVSGNGKAMHTATISGSGVTTNNNAGVWCNSAGAMDLVIREGDLDSGKKLQAPSRALFSQTTTGLFQARYVGKTAVNLFVDTGSVVYRSLGEGDLVVGNGTTEAISRLYEVLACPTAQGIALLNMSQKVGVGGVTAGNDSRIARRTVSLVDEVRESSVSPEGGLMYGQITPRSAVGPSQLAFSAALQGAPTASNGGLFAKGLGMNNSRLVAREGALAPGAGTGKFGTFVSESVGAGTVVFRATLTGGASGVTSGLWRQQPIAGGSGYSNVAVAVRLDAAHGLPAGVKYSRFLSTFVTDADVCVFTAQVTGPGVTSGNDVGVWRSVGGTTTLLFREGDFFAGGGAARIGSIQRLDVGGSGDYAVLVSMVGCGSSQNQALLRGYLNHANAGLWRPEVAVRKGELIDRPLPLPILSLSMGKNHMDATGSGSKGMAKQVQGSGVIFTARFSDKVDLLFGKP
jgi:hypothetical protein